MYIDSLIKRYIVVAVGIKTKKTEVNGCINKPIVITVGKPVVSLMKQLIEHDIHIWDIIMIIEPILLLLLLKISIHIRVHLIVTMVTYSILVNRQSVN